MNLTREPALDTVLRYHEETKHHAHRHARALGYLDWATRPDPFRRYEGADLLPLDRAPASDAAEVCYADLYGAGGPTRPLSRESLSDFFFHSLALSAWKESGRSRWALRVNPSSGNLHPTEGYLLAGPASGLSDEPALYHYVPREHALERRCTLPLAAWNPFASRVPPGAFLVGLASIHWREAWKYGERAFRYCHHDAGHAIAAVSYAARLMGWDARLLDALGDSELARLLGVDGQHGPEAEHPDAALLVYPGAATMSEDTLADSELLRPLADAVAAEDRLGRPNALSSAHHPWPIIDAVAAATRREGGRAEPASIQTPPHVEGGASAGSPSARRLLRQRRSAVDMDGRTRLSAAVFYRMLARTLPRGGHPALTPLPWRARIHLLVFVHRVDGVTPGVYLLIREPSAEALLRHAIRRDFVWSRSADFPIELPLFLLHAADARRAAKMVSCDQDIAADGAFAVAMLGEFEPSLRDRGPWFYKRLHWEAGAVGQVLYLEAEAAAWAPGAVRGTGIGCFYDDAVHELLGLTDRRVQSLYHFTIGGAVEDARLRTLDAYAHLDDERRFASEDRG